MARLDFWLWSKWQTRAWEPGQLCEAHTRGGSPTRATWQVPRGCVDLCVCGRGTLANHGHWHNGTSGGGSGRRRRAWRRDSSSNTDDGSLWFWVEHARPAWPWRQGKPAFANTAAAHKGWPGLILMRHVRPPSQSSAPERAAACDWPRSGSCAGVLPQALPCHTLKVSLKAAGRPGGPATASSHHYHWASVRLSN